MIDAFTEISVVSESHGVTLAALDGRDQVHASECHLNDLVDHGRIHAVTRGCFTVDRKLDVRRAHHDVWIDCSGVDIIGFSQLRRHVKGCLSQRLQLISVDANSHRGFDTALQHNHAAFNGLQSRSGRDTRQRGHAIDFIPDVTRCHTLAPLIFWFEHYVGFNHRCRSRIERGFDAADFP